MKVHIDDHCPEFNDLVRQPDILKQMVLYAKAHGFTDPEISDIRDRRILTILYKAMCYDDICFEIEQNKPAV